MSDGGVARNLSRIALFLNYHLPISQLANGLRQTLL